MVHVKWLIALILAVALSIHVTHRFTQEDMLAHIADELIINDSWYAQVSKEIDEGKYLSAKTKLGWLRGLEAKKLAEVGKWLEAGYFTRRHASTIDNLRRQAATPAGK